MMRFIALALIIIAVFVSHPASAHPHVFVQVRSEVVYGEGGVPSAIRHAWTFDEMFSAFATQGLDLDGDRRLTREELQELAETNVTSLSEFDFFTFARSGGNDVVFGQPRDYWLDHDGQALTLNFTLPITQAPATEDGRQLRVEIYDPTYFVAFQFRQLDAALLVSAPATCRVDTEVPDPEAVFGGGGEKLTESFFDNLDPETGFGQKLANLLVVRCGGEAERYAEAVAARQAAAPPPPADRAGDRIAQAQQLAEASPLKPVEEIAPAAPAADAEVAPDARRGGALGAFGVVRPDGGSASTTGIFGWIGQQQSAFYKKMSDALSQSRTDNSAGLMLAALAFAYGVFHAAGPGHGKAVIASYLVATGETLRRGVVLSFAAAGAQAATAIGIVVVLAWALGQTSQALGIASWWLEAASYALIVGLGLLLVWRKGGAFVRTLSGKPADTHDCGPDCGHSHAPDPILLTGQFDWRRALAAVLAVGLRPCTGALVILVFALAQGMLWAGVAATFAMALGTAITVAAIAALAVWAKSFALTLASGSSGAGLVAVRGIEMLAGVVVLLFGLALLGGLMATGTPGIG